MAKDGSIQFLGFHVPTLPSGEYSIQVRQTVDTDSQKIPTKDFSATRKFLVASERFSLNPQTIETVYPPAGGQGDYDNVLPHVVLGRSTLPWERLAIPLDPAGADDDKRRETPWLALLVFDEAETPQLQQMSLKQLNKSDGGFPDLEPEAGQAADDMVSVIEVDSGRLLELLPRPEDLDWLAHVRLSKDDKRQQELAVVLANRLPAAGQSSTVHLVSLEHHLNDTGGDWKYYFEATKPAKVRLVSLHHWSFSCLGEKFGFHQIFRNLNRESTELRLPGIGQPVVRVWAEDGELRTSLAYKSRAGMVPVVNDEFVGECFSFAGSETEYIQIDDPFPNPAEFTISLWARPRSFPAGYHALVGYGPIGSRKPCIYLWMNGQLHFDGFDDKGGNRFDFVVSKFFQLDRWTHVSLVKVGTEFRLYRDGRLFSTQPAPEKVLRDTSKPYFIGKNDNAWHGELADVRFFDRALTAKNISRLARPLGSAPEIIEDYLAFGAVPLEHLNRDGDRSVSWYGGPLRLASGRANRVPVRHSDKLLRFNQSIGMFDVSLAAAWELGRHMMLADQDRSVSLYQWYRRCARHEHHVRQHAEHEHLAATLKRPAEEAPPMPEKLRQWFDDLKLLKNVPFQYLVADERMLPPESIRFFQVNKNWVDALLDGALSIGCSEPERRADALTSLSDRASLTGFLLRSELVAAWPHLNCDAYRVTPKEVGAKDDEPLPEVNLLPRMRYERLSPNVLLGLFSSMELIKTIDFYQNPEMLHFGLDRYGVGFSKTLRNNRGKSAHQSIGAVPWREPNRVINLKLLAEKIGNPLQLTPPPAITRAQFAMEMIEGVPKARFVVS